MFRILNMINKFRVLRFIFTPPLGRFFFFAWIFTPPSGRGKNHISYSEIIRAFYFQLN